MRAIVDPDTESGEDDANRAVARQLSMFHSYRTQKDDLLPQRLWVKLANRKVAGSHCMLSVERARTAGFP
jgi:hypothetical protein